MKRHSAVYRVINAADKKSAPFCCKGIQGNIRIINTIEIVLVSIYNKPGSRKVG